MTGLRLVLRARQSAASNESAISRPLHAAKNDNRNARAVIELCQRELEASGFGNRKRTTLWRRTNVKFDILTFDVIPKSRCVKWGEPVGSFILAPSCLFPFLPRSYYAPNDGIYRPEKGYGQVRLSVDRGIPQPSVKAPNLWWAGDDASDIDSVVRDVLRTINERAIPFFSRFDDPEELLRTFLEDDDAICGEGVWDIGKEGSPQRLLYTGFAAIECKQWDLAISNLQACREKTTAMDEQVQADILPYIDEGLASAEQKRRGSDGLN